VIARRRSHHWVKCKNPAAPAATREIDEIGQTEVAVSGGLVSWRNSMWKVGDGEPVKVLRAHGYPYGFNVTREAGKPVVSFAYTTRDAAGAAATQIRGAIEHAIEVRAHPQAEAHWGREQWR